MDPLHGASVFVQSCQCVTVYTHGITSTIHIGVFSTWHGTSNEVTSTTTQATISTMKVLTFASVTMHW